MPNGRGLYAEADQVACLARPKTKSKAEGTVPGSEVSNSTRRVNKQKAAIVISPCLAAVFIWAQDSSRNHNSRLNISLLCPNLRAYFRVLIHIRALSNYMI